jgi:hypothetical protein
MFVRAGSLHAGATTPAPDVALLQHRLVTAGTCMRTEQCVWLPPLRGGLYVLLLLLQARIWQASLARATLAEVGSISSITA